MAETISVIVPVYNVDRYLQQCLDSVINQTYRDLEIILIDDGSTDRSGIICDDYARLDSRIIVIHQDNSGAGAAKNAGLSMATGDFLAFVDSDDFLPTDSFEYMHAELLAEDADVVQCNYWDYYKDSVVEAGNINGNEEMTQVEYLRLFTKDWTACLLWDKLYKRALFRGINFEVGHIVDDEFFTYQGIMNAGKIIRRCKPVYYYRKRKSSVTARPEYGQRVIFDKLEYLNQRKKKIAERYPQLKTDYDKHYFYMLNWLLRDPFSTKETISAIKTIIKQNMWACCRCGVEVSVIARMISALFQSDDQLLQAKEQHSLAQNIERYFE